LRQRIGALGRSRALSLLRSRYRLVAKSQALCSVRGETLFHVRLGAQVLSNLHEWESKARRSPEQKSSGSRSNLLEIVNSIEGSNNPPKIVSYVKDSTRNTTNNQHKARQTPLQYLGVQVPHSSTLPSIRPPATRNCRHIISRVLSQ
jgi:hypothetical protein